ncbi:Acyl dehydratase [Arthrobacter sp. 9V]|uniref:MaoC family dehydratase n=1 Tax=Arthrobacter sp. 9V TaxID=2653132 RepID=UPI0012EFBC31|nr:MaoC/PaaZ C-terminal domain-containing protein [Arthrobacter sp. 9V]VXB30300.1 Acyl dehydratase [Arthrobacter sp. 9V]
MNHPQPVVLDELPSLSKLYVNAAATAARRRVLGASTGKKRLPAVSHEVKGVRADVGNLTAYQHLVGETASDTLPAGYVHALAFPVSMSVMNRDDFPLPLLGMIHLRNKIEQLAPIQFAQDLDIRSWAENLAGHKAGTQLDVVSEVRAGSIDEVLWRGTSTYLAKGVFLPGIDKPGSPNGATGPSEFVPPNPTAVWQLNLDTGRNYAAVSGDFNPIHLSVLSAKALGLRGSIAHGMYLASRALADVGAVKADSFAWDVTFEAPVFLPARVALDITTLQTESGNWKRSDYVAWNPRSGRRHFTGSVTALA